MGNSASKGSKIASQIPKTSLNGGGPINQPRHIDKSKPHPGKRGLDDVPTSSTIPNRINEENSDEIDRILGEKDPELIGWMEKLTITKSDFPSGTTAPITPPGAVQTPPEGYHTKDPFSNSSLLSDDMIPNSYDSWTPKADDDPHQLFNDQSGDPSLSNMTHDRRVHMSPLENIRVKFNLSQMENPDFDRLPRPTAHPQWTPPTTLRVDASGVIDPPPLKHATTAKMDAAKTQIYGDIGSGSGTTSIGSGAGGFGKIEPVAKITSVDSISSTELSEPSALHAAAFQASISSQSQSQTDETEIPEATPARGFIHPSNNSSDDPKYNQPQTPLSDMIQRVNASRSSYQKNRKPKHLTKKTADRDPSGISTHHNYSIYDIPVGINRRQLESLYFPNPLKDFDVPAVSITDDQKDSLKKTFSLIPQESNLKELPYHLDDLFFQTNVSKGRNPKRSKIGGIRSVYLRTDLPKPHFENSHIVIENTFPPIIDPVDSEAGSSDDTIGSNNTAKSAEKSASDTNDKDQASEQRKSTFEPGYSKVWLVTRKDKDSVDYQPVKPPKTEPFMVVGDPIGPKYDPRRHKSPEAHWD